VKHFACEEQIKGQLRELTERTRQLRRDLLRLIRHQPRRSRANSHEHPLLRGFRKRAESF
jgi:hypothetical protein